MTNDYISRQDVLSLAKDVILINGAKHRCIDATQIHELPSVESEIIYCKNCNHSKEDKIFGGYWCMGNRVDPEHYCGYAERREDE